jgi:hypothetical protein
MKFADVEKIDYVISELEKRYAVKQRAAADAR